MPYPKSKSTSNSKDYAVTSSFAGSNSSFTSSCSPSTSTSDSAAFNMFNVTSDGCLMIGCCVGCVCTLLICLTGKPASSNAFFLSAVLICVLQAEPIEKSIEFEEEIAIAYTVLNFICSLI